MGMHRMMRDRNYKRSRPIRVLLAQMFSYLGRFRKTILIGAVTVLIGTFFSSIDPLILSAGIDLVLTPGSTIQLLLGLFVLYLGLRVISWTIKSITTWVLTGARTGFVKELQNDVYDHLIRSDLSYHRGVQSGDVTSRVTSDTVALSTGVDIIINLGSQILLLIVTFGLMWAASPLVALTALSVIPVVIFIVILFGTVGMKLMLSANRAYGAVSGQIAENLSGIQVAKAFNREEESAKILNRLIQKAYNFGFKFMGLMSLIFPLVRTTGYVLAAGILFVSAGLAIGTAPVLTIGEVFLGTILVGRFLYPLLFLSFQITSLQASLASMDRLSDVLESKPTIEDLPGSQTLPLEADGITFENLTFEYLPDTPVLKNVSFDIEPGEMVAIVGHTGAGKTTIAGLINRFYDPKEGRILIGHHDIKAVTQSSLHNHMSLIPQEPYLFDGTVIDNIRYGKLNATESEIKKLCDLIGASEFIEALPVGYNSIVTESGKNLSAGQRQMITIARTMLADPKILILDEATSRLDAYSESLVQEAQEKLFAKRTTIVIAHRLTTIRNASRIFVFDHGQLVEQGTHSDLLALNGIYKALYDTYYAHQGIEKITEERVKTAGEEIAKEPEKEQVSQMMAHIPPAMQEKMKAAFANASEEQKQAMMKKMQTFGQKLDSSKESE